MAKWNEVPEGQSILQAFEQLRDTYKTKVPGHAQQLRTLATRPISG